MRQKQQTAKVKGTKASSGVVRLGTKDHSAQFTGSPNLKTPKKILGGKRILEHSGKINKSNHPALGSPKKSKGNKTQTSVSLKASTEKAVDSAVKTPRKYRPGTKALNEIRKYQKGTDFLVQKAPFQRLVREVTDSLTDSTSRFTADALECLQTASEAFIIQVFEDSVLAMIHAKRVTLMVRDIQFIRRLRGI
ncbi:histone H3-like centromeric protein cnp1 [Daphnia pulex]|uniref:histone H3-like centromeric protein cnp1 n=1 Tax=Daphnia pulex TaxID=6669 RepID=UPI001EDE086D|nr:histone H3-like centromeric protein cnp1 [Daphnia pulex]